MITHLIAGASALVLAAASSPKDFASTQDGWLATATAEPVYQFAYDTMVGMSHCEGDCAKAWPPVLAEAGAKASGAWTLVPRSDGAQQWAYKDKPLYTAAKPGVADSVWSRVKAPGR